jgi:hypothetical protein
VLLAALLLATPLGPGGHAVSVRLEMAYVQPGDDWRNRGGGAGLSVAYHLTDQLSAIAGGSAALVWSSPAGGGPREARRLTTAAAGLEALFDATPVAPFLEVTLARVGPQSAAGYSLAVGTALGADWRLAAPFAIGLVVRTLTALDGPSSGTLGGTEIAVRLTWDVSTGRRAPAAGP